jgi:membrane protease YdiL (CAAX protease family)
LFAYIDRGTILLMNQRTIGSVWMYFLLTIALALPFWLLGALAGRQLLPALPLSALGVVGPVAAGAILSYRENGFSGVKDLLKRSFDFGRVRSKAWYLPTILLMPLVSLAGYGAMRAMGTSLPVPQIAAGKTLELFLAFFVGAICEELGWSGYAIDPLQERFGAFRAAMIVGVVWAAWHFVPLAEAHRSLEFVVWWTVGTISMRVIIVWLYNNTGRSVFVAAFFHTMSNLTWQLFPIDGSFYDPRVTGPILALAAALVVVLWGSKTFTRRSP